MNTPEGLLYHPEHTWARVEGDTATVGITDFAQDELGDVVFVELPEMGDKVSTGEVFGSIESSKSVSELFSPVDGEVVEVNQELEDTPEATNDDPYGEGWIMKVKLSAQPEGSAVVDAQTYKQQTEG